VPLFNKDNIMQTIIEKLRKAIGAEKKKPLAFYHWRENVGGTEKCTLHFLGINAESRTVRGGEAKFYDTGKETTKESILLKLLDRVEEASGGKRRKNKVFAGVATMNAKFAMKKS
jgi:hypothetical protein